MQRKDRSRIDAKILTLADNPRPQGVEKLTDTDELYRVRVGDYRIIFTIDDQGRSIAVEDVRGRDDVYRKRNR